MGKYRFNLYRGSHIRVPRFVIIVCQLLRVLGRFTDNNNSIYFNAKNNYFDPVPLTKWGTALVPLSIIS